MKNSQLVNTLQDLGLTENEARVYFASLSLGPSTIMKIAQAAELKRTTVYSVIESLKQKGLMNLEIEGFKSKFVAANPQKLDSIIDDRKKKFQSLLPEFSAMYNLQGGESLIKYYEGVEAVKDVYEGLIRDVKPGDDYLIMSNLDQWLRLDKEYFMDFAYRRAKLPIKIRLLLLDSEGAREYKKFEKNINAKIRILPKDVSLTTNLVITPQRVLINQLTPPVVGIVIENKSVINMHRETFEMIWKSLD